MLDFDRNGEMLQIYCNVALPYIHEPGHLSWVDLVLDAILDKLRSGSY